MRSEFLMVGLLVSALNVPAALSAAPRVVQPTTVGSGDEYIVVDDQGIETSGTVEVEGDGIGIFVTDGDSQIKLKPDFRAHPTTGGSFSAIATSDPSIYNDFYNMMVDGDDDGMLDALEILWGLNPFVDDADGDLDGDGVSNSDELAAGSDPMADDSEGGFFWTPGGWQAPGQNEVLLPMPHIGDYLLLETPEMIVKPNVSFF